MKIFLIIILFVCLFVCLWPFGSVCAKHIPNEQRDVVRNNIDQAADDTIAQLVGHHPEIAGELNAATGWLATRLSGAQVALLGGSYGTGVLFDSKNQTRTYMDVRRLEVGPGFGAGILSALVIMHDRESLEAFRDGTWKSSLGSSVALNDRSKVGAASRAGGEGFSVYFLSESGAVVSATARLVRFVVNLDLTDTGIGTASIPVTGFNDEGRQEEGAPRRWDHKLPFLAQQVLDKGYDLPLPYGAGITYAAVEQEQLISQLWAGVNGNDPEQFEFVSFENAFSESDSVSAKFSTWLFPFMNVFGMLGRVEGEAPLDVLLDGNGMLDQLEVDCSSLPVSPLCPLLSDKTITLPVAAKFEGDTYGLGLILAGGWNNWFVTIPMNATYAEMDGKDTDGISWTVTPRGGRLFNLDRYGNLALYVGGNYLVTELTVSGNVAIDGLISVDYRIEQENKDNWNVVVGGNWTINRSLSWSLEFNGFTGSRDAWISSLTWSF